MMEPPATEIGIHLRVLAGKQESSAGFAIRDTVLGDYASLPDLQRAAEGMEAVTFDHEHVPTEHLQQLEQQGINVRPAPHALVFAQDKLKMRTKLREIGAPVPVFFPVNSGAEAEQIWATFEGNVCLKACRGGYDGKGVWFPESAAECAEIVADQLAHDVSMMAERKVDLVRELSVMIARRPGGQTQLWPVVQSIQTNGVCDVAIAPAPDLDPALARQAQQLAETIARELDVTGSMAVELFESRDECGQPEISVNELAMRPHNTGHWTQNGCVTSQFEQHLRAVADLPLGDTRTLSDVTVMANILGAESNPDMTMTQRMTEVWTRYPAAKIHLYNKDWRPDRKMGHVNVVGEPGQGVDDVQRIAVAAAHFMVHAQWPDDAIS